MVFQVMLDRATSHMPEPASTMAPPCTRLIALLCSTVSVSLKSPP
jgi:hypothetical protein